MHSWANFCWESAPVCRRPALGQCQNPASDQWIIFGLFQSFLTNPANSETPIENSLPGIESIKSRRQCGLTSVTGSLLRAKTKSLNEGKRQEIPQLGSHRLSYLCKEHIKEKHRTNTPPQTTAPSKVSGLPAHWPHLWLSTTCTTRNKWDRIKSYSNQPWNKQQQQKKTQTRLK